METTSALKEHKSPVCWLHLPNDFFSDLVDGPKVMDFPARYWEVDEESTIDTSTKVPYRIELVGVTCDPGLAVARGIWRKIRTGRSVPVTAQLRSHRLFSENFEAFTGLVDCATLYDTGMSQALTDKMLAGAHEPKSLEVGLTCVLELVLTWNKRFIIQF